MEKDILDKINNLGVDDTIKSAIKEYAISGENEKNNLWILGITFVGMVIAFALLSWFGFSALNNLRVFVISLITIFSFLGGLIFIVKQILKNSRRMKYTQELYIKLIEKERSLLNG